MKMAEMEAITPRISFGQQYWTHLSGSTSVTNIVWIVRTANIFEISSIWTHDMFAFLLSLSLALSVHCSNNPFLITYFHYFFKHKISSVTKKTNNVPYEKCRKKTRTLMLTMWFSLGANVSLFFNVVNAVSAISFFSLLVVLLNLLAKENKTVCI